MLYILISNTILRKPLKLSVGQVLAMDLGLVVRMSVEEAETLYHNPHLSSLFMVLIVFRKLFSEVSSRTVVPNLMGLKSRRPVL